MRLWLVIFTATAYIAGFGGALLVVGLIFG